MNYEETKHRHELRMTATRLLKEVRRYYESLGLSYAWKWNKERTVAMAYLNGSAEGQIDIERGDNG